MGLYLLWNVTLALLATNGSFLIHILKKGEVVLT